LSSNSSQRGELLGFSWRLILSKTFLSAMIYDR
jgi:hypothetical protein